MFIYELEGYFADFDWVVHDKCFKEEEFLRMCDEGLENISQPSTYFLKEYLILNYGFKEMPIVHRFEFD